MSLDSTLRDEILEILSNDETDDGYGVEYDEAEDALKKAEPAIQTWLYDDPTLDAEDLAEKIYSVSEFWK